MKVTSSLWKFRLDVFQCLANTFLARDIQRDGMQSFRASLLQFCFSLLRKTSGKHVTSQLIQSLCYQVPKSSVTPGHQDVTIHVVSKSWNPNEMIQYFILDYKRNEVYSERAEHFG